MKRILIIAAALLVAGEIGYQLGQPHQDSKEERDRIHAHNMTACGAEYSDLGAAGMPDEVTVAQINQHDNPIENCRSAEHERYLGLPEGSWGRLPVRQDEIRPV